MAELMGQNVYVHVQRSSTGVRVVEIIGNSRSVDLYVERSGYYSAGAGKGFARAIPGSGQSAKIERV